MSHFGFQISDSSSDIIMVDCSTESPCNCGDSDCPGVVLRPMADHVPVPDDPRDLADDE